jgi:hypothetical protein
LFLDLAAGELKLVHPPHDQGSYQLGVYDCHGVYISLSGLTYCVYRFGEALFVRNEKCCFRLDDSVQSTFLRAGNVSSVRLFVKCREIENIVHVVDDKWDIPGDFTPYVEAEHFDFALFVHHLVCDAGRRQRIWPYVVGNTRNVA